MCFKNKTIFTAKLLMIFLVSFSVSGGCGGGDDNGGINSDSPSVAGDDPNPPETGTGVIRGTVVSPDGTPLNGVHVRAVNIDDTKIQISSFSGIDSNLIFVNGAFSIQNIPPGSYRVLIERMDSRNAAFVAFRRYSDFMDAATTPNFPDEYYNGSDESDTDNTFDFEVITVTNGSTVDGINIITNGIGIITNDVPGVF